MLLPGGTMASCIPFAATTRTLHKRAAHPFVVAYEIQHGRRCYEIEAVRMAQACHGAAAVGLGLAALAHATNYTLWVNGRTGGGQLGNYADFTYWGRRAPLRASTRKAVNWDGYNSISNQNYLVRNALDCYCTGTNWCYIGAHSAGNLQVGFTLAMYGGFAHNPTHRRMLRACAARQVPARRRAGTSSGWTSPAALRAGLNWPTPAAGH